MAIDGMGRLIVGSGHFIENSGMIMANVEPAMNMANHIVVGGGHHQFLEKATQATIIFNQAIETLQSSSIPDPHLEYANENDYQIITIKKHKDSAEETGRAIEKAERVKERLKKLGEAGLDLGQAFGYGAAGDIGNAYDKAADAAYKMGEVYWDNFKEACGK